MIEKNKKGDDGIKFEYKKTDFEEGDMITAYKIHENEKKLRLKYPGGIPKELLENFEDPHVSNKLYKAPDNFREILKKIK